MTGTLPRWLIIGLFALGLLLGAREGAARDIIVDDDVVRLGDLFVGLTGSQAMTAVAKAPAPGQAVTVNPRWLARLARSHGVPSDQSDTHTALTVRRLGTTISAAELTAAVKAAVIEHTGLTMAEIRLDGGTDPMTHVGGGKPTISVQDLRFDVTDGRFFGSLVATSDGQETERRTVSGRAIVMVDVPVLARALSAGTQIGPNDVTTIAMAADTVAPNVLTDAESLTGKITGRSLRPGRPILEHEISEPLMVERGKPVTMLFRHGALVISARGKALVDGSEGEIVRVLNIDSGRTVEATVIAPDTVSLDANGSARPTTTALVR